MLNDVVISSPSGFRSSDWTDGTTVSVTSNGTMIWGFGGPISTICYLDLTKYPFDKHRCLIELQSLGTAYEQVSYRNHSDRIGSEFLA